MYQQLQDTFPFFFLGGGVGGGWWGRILTNKKQIWTFFWEYVFFIDKFFFSCIICQVLLLLFVYDLKSHLMWVCVCVSCVQSAYILFYMAIVGHALSIPSLLISLAIFFYFR